MTATFAPENRSRLAAADVLAASPHASLTARETEVLTCVAAGLRNVEIAREMTVELSTVKRYVRQLLTKLGARDRVALVLCAIYREATTKPSTCRSAPIVRASPTGPNAAPPSMH